MTTVLAQCLHARVPNYCCADLIAAGTLISTVGHDIKAHTAAHETEAAASIVVGSVNVHACGQCESAAILPPLHGTGMLMF